MTRLLERVTTGKKKTDYLGTIPISLIKIEKPPGLSRIRLVLDFLYVDH